MSDIVMGLIVLFLLTACTAATQTPQQKCESTGGAWNSAAKSCQWPAELPKK